MKINTAKSAGFCFGVKRALNIAKKTAQEKNEIYMLGDIVHNEDVVKEIKKLGIKRIEKLRQNGKNRILLVRAHGENEAIIQKARIAGYTIVDATCPMVKEIHRIAKEMEKKGYTILIIGDKFHDEVRGIIGQLKTKALVIEKPYNLPLNKIKKIKKICVLTQSTQNLENVDEIVDKIRGCCEKLKFFNTICKPTSIKQREIKSMPLSNDVMIIIGSKASANTKRLYEISKSLNKRSYWVQSKKGIKASYFKGAKNTGITSGASTPDSTTRMIIGHIRKITRETESSSVKTN